MFYDKHLSPGILGLSINCVSGVKGQHTLLPPSNTSCMAQQGH